LCGVFAVGAVKRSTSWVTSKSQGASHAQGRVSRNRWRRVGLRLEPR
jgi:hypothetical protein